MRTKQLLGRRRSGPGSPVSLWEGTAAIRGQLSSPMQWDVLVYIQSAHYSPTLHGFGEMLLQDNRAMILVWQTITDCYRSSLSVKCIIRLFIL